MNRSRPRPVGIYDGALLVDKTAGPTSHDVVDRIRRRFRFDKVGHGGTLDPQATGLLVVLIERGTKMSNEFLTSDKTYQGVMRLGSSTDTQDAQGKIVAENDWSSVTREQVEAEMSALIGDLMQTPPMVSAVKKDGVPLYKLARKGKTVERNPKLIHIYEFNLRDFSPPLVSFVLRCTKGTYVRTLCSDIGEKLGCFAHLAELRRTRAGRMNVENAVPFNRVLEMTQDELLPYIIPLHKIGVTT
ncbi:MAG: tRNA pseudouridine(55) synthase TruB [Lentisphaerales bacterium]|nr:MAG: tRNA pseudouridine(55) synthase TruB [Lentisphaerales bacterium]